jgi:hypothetical protein
MALDALWMLGFASHRGFRECAWHHVSTHGASRHHGVSPAVAENLQLIGVK